MDFYWVIIAPIIPAIAIFLIAALINGKKRYSKRFPDLLGLNESST